MVSKHHKDVESNRLVRNQENFLVLMQNYGNALKYAETSANSTGYALQKFAVYQDSVEAHQNRLTAAFEQFSTTVLNGNFIKSLLDIGTGFLNIANGATKAAGVLPMITSALSGILTATGTKAGILTPFGFGNMDLSKLKEASKLIFDYNSSLLLGTKETQKFINVVQSSNPELAKYMNGLNGAQASVGNYGASLVAATAKTVGLQIATTALNAAISFGIGVIIQLAVTGIMKLVNANKEAIDTARELQEVYESATSEISGNISTLEGLDEEFSKLSKGVDENGKNISLTADEYKRYKDIVSQVIGISPQLIQGYNDEGDAIVCNNGFIEDAIKLQEELNRVKMQEYLAGGGDILKGSIAEIKEANKEIEKISQPYLGDSLISLLAGDTNINNLNKLSEILDEIGVEYDYLSQGSGYANIQIKDYDVLVNSQDQLLQLAQERLGIDEESSQAIRNRLGLIDIELQKIDNANEKVRTYLSLWASQNSEFYPKIKTEYLNEFDSALEAIASDTSLSIEEMQVAVNDLGKDFFTIQDQLPTEQISLLKEQLANGSIDAEEFKIKMEEQIAIIDELAIKYPNLAELLGMIANGYRGVAEGVDREVAAITSLTAFESALSQVSQSTLEASDHMVLLYHELDNTTQQFNDGTISAETYFNVINTSLDAMDWSNLEAGTEAMKLQMSAFMSLAQMSAEGLTNLQTNFDNGKLSIEDYINGLMAAGESQIALNNELLETSANMYESDAAYQAATADIQAQNDAIQNSIGTINELSDSLIYLDEIGSNGWNFDVMADNASAMANSIANDLWNIAQTSDIVAQTIGANNATSFDSIYNYLMSGNANFQAVTTAMMGDANSAISTLMTNVGTSIQSIGDAIAKFKMTLKITPNISWTNVPLSGLASKMFGDNLSIPGISFDISADGSNVSIGNALSNIGSSLKSYAPSMGLQLSDFTRDINSGSNALNNLGKAGNAAGGGTKNAADGTKAAAAAAKELTEVLKEQKEIVEAEEDAINDLLEITIKMIKKEQELEKERLKTELEGYKEEIDAKKEAIQQDLDNYETKISKQKELLRLKEKERSYEKELAKKQKEYSDIESQLVALQYDDSEAAQKRRLELEQQLAVKTDEISEFQHDRSIELTEDALDKELKRFTEVQKAKKTALETEYSQFKTIQDQKIKDIETYLKQEGVIRQDAIALIEGKTQEFYKRLLWYNKIYGDGVDATIQTIWNNAYDALMHYNDGQIQVINTLNQLKSIMASLDAQIKDATNSANALNSALANSGGGGGGSSGGGGGGSSGAKKWYILRADGSVFGGPYNSQAEAQQNLNYGSKGKNLGLSIKQYVSIKQYAKGTLGVSSSQNALVDELGREIIVRKNGGRLTHLETGDGVIPHNQTEALLGLANNPVKYISDALSKILGVGTSSVENNTTSSPSIDARVIIQGSIDKDSMSDFKNALRQQHTLISNLVSQDLKLGTIY